MLTLHRILAFALIFLMSFSPPAEKTSLLGMWCLNEDGILQLSGLTKEEYDQLKQMGVELTVTMEFEKDGIVVIVMSVAGQHEKTQYAYEVKDGKLLIDGDPADFTIKGNTMTITQDDIKMTLTKISG